MNLEDLRLNKINTLLCQADDLAIAYIEEEARRVLRRYKTLDEFIMGMGSAFFTRKKPNEKCPIYGSCDGCVDCLPKYANELLDNIEELNEYFKTKGYPMRLTATGPIVRDW